MRLKSTHNLAELSGLRTMTMGKDQGLLEGLMYFLANYQSI